MTAPIDIDLLCAEALQRIIYHINRSAGQHCRAMRKTWSQTK